MTEQTKIDFLKKLELQVEKNMLTTGDHDRPMEKLAMIAGEHMGHLFNAVMAGERDRVEKELLHVATSLLELYQENVKNNKGPTDDRIILII